MIYSSYFALKLCTKFHLGFIFYFLPRLRFAVSTSA